MWQLPALLRVLVANVVFPVVLKKIVGRDSRTRRFRSQYLFAVIFAVSFAIFARNSFSLTSAALIGVLGFVQSFGAYSSWRAIDISLSKTALATQLDDVIGMGLGFVLLGEIRYLSNAFVSWGITFVLLAVILYTLGRRTSIRDGKGSDTILLLWILGYSIFWGIAFFAIRFFALQDFPISIFLVSWYVGSFIGSQVLYMIAGASEAGSPLTISGYASSAVLALLIFAALGFQYWASIFAPIAVTQPIYQVAEMILPALLGFYYFKERQQFSRTRKAAFAFGIIGMLLIAFSF